MTKQSQFLNTLLITVSILAVTVVTFIYQKQCITVPLVKGKGIEIGKGEVKTKLAFDDHNRLTYTTTFGDSTDTFTGVFFALDSLNASFGKGSRIEITIADWSIPFGIVVIGYRQDNGDTLITEVGLPLFAGQQTYSLKVGEIPIPDWWSKLHNTDGPPLLTPNYNFPLYLGFGIAKTHNVPANSELKYTLSSISVTPSKWYTSLYYLLSILPILSLFLYRSWKSYQMRVAFISSKEGKSAIESAIGDHWSLEECNLQFIADQLKIPRKTVEEFCQREYKCNFAKHLQLIRITEAERLLQESDLLVKEIAREIGYKQVTQFNKEYKLRRGITPTESRTLRG